MRLALLGSPVAHSLSPVMHRAALAHIGRSGDYQARDVDKAGLLASLREIRTGSLAGANVTMPHKALAFESCDRPVDRALRVRAVNTLVLRNGELVGENTDIDGVQSAWSAAGLSLDQPVVVLGAGGAAAAALVATEGRPQYVVARNLERAQSVIDHIGAEASVVEWGTPVPLGVVINATSLGMKGESLPAGVLDSAVGLLDMAYGDAVTPAVTDAAMRGLPVADGLDMLVGQAVVSFSLWTGAEVEAAVFRRAAEDELLKRSQSWTRVEE